MNEQEKKPERTSAIDSTIVYVLMAISSLLMSVTVILYHAANMIYRSLITYPDRCFLVIHGFCCTAGKIAASVSNEILHYSILSIIISFGLSIIAFCKLNKIKYKRKILFNNLFIAKVSLVISILIISFNTVYPIIEIVAGECNCASIASFDLRARTAGRNMRLAVEAIKQEKTPYSSDLEELFAVDRNLTDDPCVTFSFLHASETGYAFYTTHIASEEKNFWLFTSEDKSSSPTLMEK